jgi:hypothetical protein
MRNETCDFGIICARKGCRIENAAKGRNMTIEEAEEFINEENEDRIDEAKERFARATGGNLEENCKRLTEETAIRFELVMNGLAPTAFGAYDRDDIARILNTDTVISFDGYKLEVESGTKEVEDWRDAAAETTWYFEAVETHDRRQFIDAYENYLHMAAAFAKSIGATHAMHLYLRAWGLVRETYEQGARLTLTPEESIHAVNLEKAASSRLWLDLEAAKLPPFKPRKPKPSKKPAKTAKKRNRKG